MQRSRSDPASQQIEMRVPESFPECFSVLPDLRCESRRN